MTGALEGKVALVTGGSRGIGAAVALRLAAAGADVAITYQSSKERAEGVAARVREMGRRAMTIAADNEDADAVVHAVERAAEELGRLDVLVNNAGIFPYGPLEEVTREEVDRTLGVHVRASFLAAQAAARHMGGGGSIVCIGSSLAERVDAPGMTLYSTSKAALGGLVRGLARDLGPRGITANVVHPGPVDTEMNPADGEAAGAQRAATALGRFGTADEIAATVLHLAGPGGRFITGAAIVVDGGSNA